MFSFLDMINSSLSYFNIKPTLKNKIYIAIATLGDGYLIYVTCRLFLNQVWLRGLLYCCPLPPTGCEEVKGREGGVSSPSS